MPDIAIIGGGIGGLTTAVALRRYGFDAHVFEQAPALLDLGAAIALWPNAMRALQHLDLADKVLANAGVINEIRWLNPEGKTFNSVRITNPATPAVAVHRADLQKILLQSVPSSAVKLGYSFLKQHHEPDSTTVSFTNSESIDCRFLIGADGVHSDVRSDITDQDSLRFRGYIVWRGISSVMPSQISPDAAMELTGRGKRFGIGPVGSGRVGWWAAANDSLENPIGKESAQDAHNELLELFQGWYSPVLELVQATKTILRTAASDRSATTTWGRGRMTLLGDAIHPTTPNLGQGGCMAIEDSVVLARCFEKYGPSEAALRAYERARYGRTAAITATSRIYGQIGQWENRTATTVRRAAISVVPEVLIKQLMRIIFDYDAARVRI
jgi:2-polyprenyl-6-methoxyphenol hydroxylase-like FAD-dependent oxidoreductase